MLIRMKYLVSSGNIVRNQNKRDCMDYLKYRQSFYGKSNGNIYISDGETEQEKIWKENHT